MKNRLLAHAITTRRTARKALPTESMNALERTIGMAERGSSGQIRLVVEAAWPLLHVKHNGPRARAVQWFSELRVWDTEHNNGVLIYLLFAECDVEIIADRGFNNRIAPGQWETICRCMEARFAKGGFAAGLAEGINTIGNLLREQFPAEMAGNEQPDRPMIV